MTTNMMSCDGFTGQLMAYLERETDDATGTAMERHAVTCAECGALLAELRKLRIDAANLPPMQPSRDLWAGIAERIEAPVVSIQPHLDYAAEQHVDIVGGINKTGAVRSINIRKWLRVTSIAAGLVFAASVGYFARGPQMAVTPTDVVAEIDPMIGEELDTSAQIATAPETTYSSAVTPATSPRDPVPVVTTVSTRSPEIVAAERAALAMSADYDLEIKRLRTLIDSRRNQLDPVTVAVIEKNLMVIDTAIAECKKAIARDPASGFLMESLNQSLRTKVELMRTAALLPSRT